MLKKAFATSLMLLALLVASSAVSPPPVERVARDTAIVLAPSLVEESAGCQNTPPGTVTNVEKNVLSASEVLCVIANAFVVAAVGQSVGQTIAELCKIDSTLAPDIEKILDGYKRSLTTPAAMSYARASLAAPDAGK